MGFFTDGRLPADVMFVFALLYSLPQRGHAPRIHAPKMSGGVGEALLHNKKSAGPVPRRVACGRSFRGLSENVSFCFELHVVIAE